MAEQTPVEKVSFKNTLNLPHTDFPIRANPAIEDVKILERWQQERLYQKTFECNNGKETFILHDGPPYSNGHIHIGHAYNKILKDIVTKSQRMIGKHVPVIPGWDCHGLPIELKVTQENPELKGAALKNACRVYAQKWIDIQKEEFKRIGVLMNWDDYYSTMSYSYESSILKAFAQFVQEGYIERKNKTVPWCAECQTVLAQAEIEYQEQKDPSVYVLFPLEENAIKELFPSITSSKVSLLVWTTTPWTLPLNKAVLCKPDAEYVVLEVEKSLVIVGAALADRIATLMGSEKKVVGSCMAQELVKKSPLVNHPFITTKIPLLCSDTVSLEDGTALVHCAPGCGPEDYEVGIRNNLEIFSPITPDGKYTTGIQPQELEGLPVKEGQIWVIKKLAELGMLFHKASIKHPYPYCWRSRTPLIFRATKQWFCDLEKNNLKEQALHASDSINALPNKSINRLQSTLENRLEWVLSRQRIWGVPIPAFICSECDYTYSTPELIKQVAEHIAQEGIEYWDRAIATDLLPKDFKCPPCGNDVFIKENDILDVWFESGVSHFAVLMNNQSQRFPANMYLEGKDQHRAWFQSSLLTAMVLEKQPPMKEIVTHGFTVDGQGRKMSKSLGNVVSPAQMIEQLGTDGLRLWASSIDIAGEAIVSPQLLDNIKEVYRKIRNTSRFLLSNIYDFDIQHDAIPLDKLLFIDQYALQELFEVNCKIIRAYNQYDFTAIFHILSDYCSVQLSSFYLDIIKDRLYTHKANGHLRRSAQTSCWYILDTLTRLIAPIMSFTAEQISDHYQKEKKESIHLQEFAHLSSVWQFLAQHNVAWQPGYDALKTKQPDVQALITMTELKYNNEYHERWQMLKAMRNAVLKAIELQRETGIIKHSLEAQVTLHVAGDAPFLQTFNALLIDLENTIQKATSFFEEFFIVSQVMLVTSSDDLAESEMPGLFISVKKANGDKCPRCWQWKETKHPDKLCQRCAEIVSTI